MPVTVNVEEFSEGPTESVRKVNLLVDAITELQQDTTMLEALVGVGGGAAGTLELIVVKNAVLYTATFAATLGALVEPVP